jgi:PhzF family phenazine biosynthesis protein
MKTIPIYQIDAFTNRVFSGNPAAVCPLEAWPEDALLQAIAQENNLSETAFFVPNGDGYHIRWFTPVAEVDLCGHATLATAFVIFGHSDQTEDNIRFDSRSGTLSVTRILSDGGSEGNPLLVMDFPSQPPLPCAPPVDLLKALGREPAEVLRSEDYFVVFPDERDVTDLEPEMQILRRIDLRGVIVTARGKGVDFVSRFFAPKFGIDEDPVTGSAHCALTPYWAKRLEKKKLHAHQVSRRGGEILCEDLGDRVGIAGHAVQFMAGTMTI